MVRSVGSLPPCFHSPKCKQSRLSETFAYYHMSVINLLELVNTDKKTEKRLAGVVSAEGKSTGGKEINTCVYVSVVLRMRKCVPAPVRRPRPQRRTRWSRISDMIRLDLHKEAVGG